MQLDRKSINGIFFQFKSNQKDLQFFPNKMTSLIVNTESLDKWDSDSNSLLVIDVVVAEEVDEGELLDVDPAGEKLPGDDRVDDEANGIA